MFLVNPSGITVEARDKLGDRLLEHPGFRKATIEESEVYKLELTPPKGSTVYFSSSAQTPDGYGQSSQWLRKALAKTGVLCEMDYREQNVGLLFGYPYGLDHLQTPVKFLYSMFESTTIPPDWPEYCELADKIFVPSKFCKKVFATRGIKSEVIPLGYNDELFKYRERPTRSVFTFLHYDAFNTRKGWDILFRAFTKEFKPGEPVKLVLKTVRNKLPFPILKSQYPNIEVIKSDLSPADLAELVYSADCFVFPSRGEGFGLPPLEALATGLPVLIPNASGMSEYFDHRYFFEIEIEKNIPALYKRFPAGDTGEMVLPSEKSIRQQMRFIYEHQDQARDRGRSGAAWVKDNFSIKHTAEKLSKKLEPVLTKPRKSPIKVTSGREKADLNLVTLLLGSCGYSIAAEQLVLGLAGLGYKVNVASHEDRKIESRWMTPEFREIVSKKRNPADKTLVFTPPIFMRGDRLQKNASAYTMFETENLSQFQVTKLNRFDNVIVTCKHSKEAFERSGVTPPLSIAHLCVDYSKYEGELLPHDGFVFFSHGTHSVRKGTDLMLRAFLAAFPDEDDVRLVIKDTPASKFRFKHPDSRIERIAGNISEQELINKIASADCGLFPSRGEGWGLGAMECMALGLPVILTDYGGLAAMCHKKYNFPLRVGKLSPAVTYFIQHTPQFYDIGEWAEPDFDHLVELMRYVYENQDEAKRKGQLVAGWIRRKFTRERQATLVAEALNLGGKKGSKVRMIKHP